MGEELATLKTQAQLFSRACSFFSFVVWRFKKEGRRLALQFFGHFDFDLGCVV